MFGLAVLGIAVNGFAAPCTSRGVSVNERVVSWYLLEDVLGWAAVLVAAGVRLLVEGADITDPLLSLAIAAFVLFNVIRHLRRAAVVFLQKSPPKVDIARIERELSRLLSVCSLHHTCAWSLDGQTHVLSMHVVVCEDTERTEVVAVRQGALQLVADVGVEHATIQVECADEPCPGR